VIALRKDTSQRRASLLKRGDLFDIVIQITGGSASSPSFEDYIRLRRAAKHYRNRAIVQFSMDEGRLVKILAARPSNAEMERHHGARQYSGEG
jgi:hypothetical protein